jgi:hypothetical protein
VAERGAETPADTHQAERPEAPDIREPTPAEPSEIVDSLRPGEVPESTDTARSRLKYDSSDLDASGPDGSAIGPIEQQQLRDVGAELADVVPPEVWARSSVEQRAQLVNNAFDHLQDHYRLPPGATMQFVDHLGQDYGEYDPGTRTVELSDWMLSKDNPSDAISTVSHEVYHDYQQNVMAGTVEGPVDSDKRSAWIDADRHYGNFNDFAEYLDNQIESDAFAVEEFVMAGYWNGRERV